jgi:hypothetical protein
MDGEGPEPYEDAWIDVNAAGILLQAHVPYIRRAVFDAPLSAREVSGVIDGHHDVDGIMGLSFSWLVCHSPVEGFFLMALRRTWIIDAT